MSACGYSDECGLQYAPQFDASRASESFQPSHFFSFRNQITWSMDSNEDRSAFLLPSFGSLMQDVGLRPAKHDLFAHHAASPPSSLRFLKDCGSFATPSMVGGAGAQNTILALASSHLLSSRSAMAVSAASFGFSFA